MNTSQGFVTTRQYAELLQLNQEYVRRLRRQEKVRATRVAQRWLIDASELKKGQRYGEAES